MAVVLCESCERFVREMDARCPFCNAAREPLAREYALARGTRSAIAAMAALGSLAACDRGASTVAAPAPEPGTTVVQALAQPVAADAASAHETVDVDAAGAHETVDAGELDAGADAAVADASRPRARRVRAVPVIRASAPQVRYGAPPPPDELV